MPRVPKPTDRSLDPLQEALKAPLKPDRASAPSDAAIQRWSAVPLLYASTPPRQMVPGHVVFDAWSEGGVALRDATSGHTRCLTLGAGSLLLDLVAWRDSHHWQFTARVRHEERVRHDAVLKTGRLRLLPDSGGFFQWRSRGVPRLLELWSVDQCIAFEPIAWK